MLSSLLATVAGAVNGVSSPSPSPADPASSASTSASSTPALSASSTAPPSPASPSSPPSCASLALDLEDLALDTDDRFEASGYFQRLVKRGGHHPNRIRAIKRAAIKEEPPREPGPWECCGGGCALDCVVTIWWEEEKTWRDLHPDWKSIKQRIKEEEEDRKREEEEEAALNGGGEPAVEIGVEEEGDGAMAEGKTDGGPEKEEG